MANIKQNADGSTALYSDQEGKELLRVGGPATPVGGLNATFSTRVSVTYKIPLVGATAVPFTAVMANVKLSDDDIVCEKVEIKHLTTAPACTFDVGFAASAGLAATTTLLSAQVTTALTTSTLSGGTTALGTIIPGGSFISVTPQSISCGGYSGTLLLTGYKL